MLLLKNGRVIDPAAKIDAERDVLVENGKISKVERGIKAGTNVQVIDVSGCDVLPGLIDIHVHFREPGFEYKEDILSGQRAAARGGFTAVVPMPNTEPAIDQAAAVQSILERSRRAGLVRLYPVGCASSGRKGKALSEYGDMKENGIVAISDDGDGIGDSHMQRCVLEYAKNFDLPYFSHAEDAALANRGSMHEGEVSLKLGLRGMPREAESLAVQKEIILSRMTGGRVHFAHVSAWESVEAIRRAKKEGLPITMEVAPHHLFFIDADMPAYDANYKMNPPLREAQDRDALLRSIEDGTCDAIASDHAPHATFEKEVEFSRAPFGIVGLETTVPVVYQLAKKTGIPLTRWIELMSSGPARVLRLPGGSLAPGKDADITVVKTGVKHTIDPAKFYSKGRNTPFAGMTFENNVVYTVCGGRLIYDEAKGVSE